ncbi:hypothetical protein [Romboutsia sp.]|uniref:hypothetical protein n=1 Tax=Romboutsia sp. TaxID=1965302 RepID=UPI002C3D9541|nr:hypothetical protein [Romboutsia sp.]HSQ87940.1 hypothetical protein [Romboutsia sp.]
MNKLAVSLFLIATTLLTIAFTKKDWNYNNIIDFEPFPVINNEYKTYLDQGQSTVKSSINLQKPSNTIKIPINIVSKDTKNIKYLEIKKDSSLQQKIEIIISTISKECFNNLPIKITVYGKNTAKIELIEPKDSTKNRVSWKKDYLNEYTKEYTINTIIKNVIQEEYKGDWIEKVQLYYEDELIQLD